MLQCRVHIEGTSYGVRFQRTAILTRERRLPPSSRDPSGHASNQGRVKTGSIHKPDEAAQLLHRCLCRSRSWEGAGRESPWPEICRPLLRPTIWGTRREETTDQALSPHTTARGTARGGSCGPSRPDAVCLRSCLLGPCSGLRPGPRVGTETDQFLPVQSAHLCQLHRAAGEVMEQKRQAGAGRRLPPHCTMPSPLPRGQATPGLSREVGNGRDALRMVHFGSVTPWGLSG